MILASLNDTIAINSLGEKFAPLFNYLATHNLAQTPIGKIELDGARIFLTITHSMLVTQTSQPLEAHRQYIDVHIPLSVNEIIGWRALDTLQSPRGEYDPNNDIAFFNDTPSTFITLTPENFLVAYPTDAHAPLIGVANTQLKKIIAKILI